MERLISSPLHLTRAPSRPRSAAAHLLPPTAAPPSSFPHRAGLGFGARLPQLAPLLLLRRPPPVVAQALPAEASAHSPVPHQHEDDDSAAGEDAPAGAARVRRFFQKVAVFTLLAALVLSLLQPSSVFSPGAALASALHGHGHGHSAAAVVTATRTSIFKSELLGSAWTGFLAGCLHTLSGPDHLAALAPLSIGRSAAESAAVGALWGCGHDAGQVLFGLLFLGLKDRLRLEVLRAWGTRVVGLTLLVIGAIGIREATQPAAPCVALHDAAIGTGTHDPSSSSLEKALLSGGGKKKEISFATFATGIVHGLQPDALMIILPALALPSRLAGAAFLGMFLVGTVLSMASYTVLIGTCTEALRERVPRITEKLTWAASLVAISMGLAIIASESFGVSLF
ncbi:uncharacterized protein LOC100839056 [Brachypodium distachyon]|uniref:Uncharacterized protein n=1 Tax=Brachypodium distachyon TaxID=15368 RepID=I1H1H2_BRADI|nr:uncharacterized protein LOC100839056 [Brachypodium distachyon]KQK19814.1 hypothetical protein BRADI_1g50620v3 [Brachypodium distachyon]|eukprot:XP_003561163.1 uncharacterized protein LOC100839056 [Brachypodium distachyon]